MKALVLGVVQDLRNRRLLPVAAVLAVALVAVPVLLLKPAEEAAPVTAAPVTPPAGAEGLPSPEQALQGNGKPLVSLAVLDQPSELASFDSKNPFEPLETLEPPVTESIANGDLASAAADESKSGGTGGGGGGGGTPDTAPGGGSPTPTVPGPGTIPTDPETTEPQKFTYTLDATLDAPSGVRRYRNMPRLRMLPSENAPLLVFLGVDAAGEKAVFLVDSTVTIGEGEGGCTPSRSACATLSLEPGERQVFTDADGDRYTIQIDQIRERSLASVAKAAKAAAKRKKLRAKVAVGSERRQPRRFTPPVLAEILTGVES